MAAIDLDAERTADAVEIIVRPGFGRPAMSFTTTHFEALTGRKPTSLRQLFEANKAALLAAPAAR